MKSKKDLHNYQTKMVDVIHNTKRCGLFMDMGLGKTITTLTAISELLDLGAIKKVLIVAPLRVANNVWHNEATKWTHTKHLKFSIVTGEVAPKTRLQRLNNNQDITVVNIDSLAWLYEHNKIKFDMIVIDESSLLKNKKTRRWKTLTKFTPPEYIVLLTGTPAANSLLDIWAQIFILDKGLRLGVSYEAFRNKYFYILPHCEHQYTPYKHSMETVVNKIKDITFRLSANDYLKLPENITIDNISVLPIDVMKKYKYLEEELIYKVSHDEKISIATAMALSNKLLQFCNGFIYDENKGVHIIHTEKIKALKEIIETYPDENILIAYYFKYDLDLLARELASYGPVVLSKSAIEVDAWNKGKIRILLAHARSAGHGLNLQDGGSIIVWYSIPHSLECYMQFNARLSRQGQKKVVRIIRLVIKDGIDEQMLPRLAYKDKQQSKLLNLIDFLQSIFKVKGKNDNL